MFWQYTGGMTPDGMPPLDPKDVPFFLKVAFATCGVLAIIMLILNR